MLQNIGLPGLCEGQLLTLGWTYPSSHKPSTPPPHPRGKKNLISILLFTKLQTRSVLLLSINAK